MYMKKIAVIGLGYVGLPLALLASKKGYEVYGVDINRDRVDKINQHQSPFLDNKIEEELKNTTLKAMTDFSVVRNCDIVIICVPTPISDDKIPNLGPVEGACNGIAKYIKKESLIILESTVNPGVCETIVIPLLEAGSGLKAGIDFYIAHCPERINPGDKKWNVENINRVIGSLEKTGLEIASDFYSSIISGKIHLMNNLKEAEAVKIVENSFRDINIAFVNELAMSFSRLGIDIVNVIKGAETKPFSFLAHYPGCGVGGHCIPVDPYYLIEYVKKENGFNHAFLSLAREINNNMPKFTVDMLTSSLKEKGIGSEGTKITILGVSYKANIDDYRESPAFDIISEAQKQGYSVSIFDPYVLEKSTAKNLKDALKDSIAVIVVTNHKEFKDLTPSFFVKNKISFVIDGRNCLDKDKFVKTNITYKGIGR
jgi:UDP-N-acetyl-D-glucosamine dehydrogenase